MATRALSSLAEKTHNPIATPSSGARIDRELRTFISTSAMLTPRHVCFRAGLANHLKMRARRLFATDNCHMARDTGISLSRILLETYLGIDRFTCAGSRRNGLER